jgi:hypothetical protein
MANGGLSDERRPPGEQLKEHAPRRVEIGASVDRLALGLFGRKVLRGPDHRLGLGHRRGAVGDGSRDPEVHDLDGTTTAEHDVGRFDVAVDDPLGVAVVQRCQDVLDDSAGLVGRRHRSCGGEVLAQGAAVDDLHDDVGNVDGHLGARVDGFVLARVINRDDVGVVEPRGGLGLPPESTEEHRVTRQVGAQQLDGHRPGQPGIESSVDIGHAPATDDLTDLVSSAKETSSAHESPPLRALATASSRACRTGCWRRPSGHRDDNGLGDGDRSRRADPDDLTFGLG